MAAAKEITLKVNIDPSGAVSGAQALEGTQKQILSAFTKNNAALKGLESAYKVGRDAVNKYNLEAQIAINLLGAHTKAGTAAAERVAKMTTENIRMLASIKELNAELSRKEAADRSAAASAAASAQALGLGVRNLERLVAAYAGGRAAIEAFNREKYIEQTVFASMAGKTQAEIQAIANDAAKHWDLTAAVKALENGLRGKEAAMEAAHAAALADNAAMDLAKQKTDAFVVSIQAEVARLQGLAAAYNGGRAGIAAFNLAHEIQNRQMRAGVSATSAAGQAIEQFTRQEYAARTAVDLLERELKEKEKALRGVKPAADHATHGLTAFQTAVTTLATVALNRLRNEIIGARQSFDRMTNTFAVSSNSSAEAADKMNFLRSNANKLGLDIRSVGVSFAKFDVAAQNTSLSSSEIRDIFVSVSEATTAMGLSSEVAEGAILALQQMISKGTVQSEELRGQFAERIPGAFRLAAEAMGWTQLELAKNLEQGRVLSEDLLPKLAAKLHEVFGPGSVAGSKLLSAEINRLKNEWFDFLVETSQEIKLPQVIRVLSDSFETLTFVVKTFLALGLITYFPVLYEKITLLAASMKAATVAANEFWVAMLGGKVGISAIIATLIIAGYELNKAINDWKTESTTAMAGYVADGEKVVVQLGNIRDLYIELDKLNPFNKEGGTPNVTANMLKAINEEVSKNEENLQSNIKRMEELKKKLTSPSENYNTNYNAMGGFSSNLDAIEADRKEYENLAGTTGVLSEKLKKLKERQFDAKQEMFNAAATSKVADDAMKEYDKDVADITARYKKGLFANLGGEELNKAQQYAEWMRQLADARKAYDNAIAPGRAKNEAKSMREAASAANAYQKEVDRMLKKYDEFNTAQKNFDDAMAMAEELYKAGEFGAYGSAEAQARLNEIQQNGANMLMDELSPGLRQANEEMAKLNIQMDNQLAANNSMLGAYKRGADAVDEQTRAIGIAAITEDILTKAKANSVTIDADYVASTQRKAAAVYDSNVETELAKKLYEDTSGIETAIEQNEQYAIALKAGSEALMDVAAYQAAYNAIVKPGAKITAEMWLAIMKLTDANKDLAKSQQEVSGTKIIDDLEYETEWLYKYADALRGGSGALAAFNIEKQIADARRSGQLGDGQEILLRAKLADESIAQMEKQFAEITKKFHDDLSQGFQSSLTTFFTELGQGNEDAMKNFKESMIKVLLEAVAKWLTAMLVAIAKAAVASKAIGGGTGSFGGGGSMSWISKLFGGGGGAAAGAGAQAGFTAGGTVLGPVAGGGTWGGSLATGTGAGGFGTTGASTGGMSAMAAMGAALLVVAAVLVAVNAVRKHAEAVKYGTTVTIDASKAAGVYAQSLGKLQETGPAIANGVLSVVNALESAGGVLIESMPKIELKIRNDKKIFSVWIEGEFLGKFKSVEEAIKNAALAAFRGATFKDGEKLAPIFADMVKNFDGKDVGKLIENMTKVRAALDSLNKLTEVEIKIRDLDNTVASFRNELEGMGVSMSEAANLARQFKVQQLQDLRDQITGHQQTEAEARAIFERQRAAFNAKLIMDKLEMIQDKAKLEADLAILDAGGTLMTADQLSHINYLQTKAELYGEDARLEGARLTVMGASNNAMREIINAAIASLNAAIATLDTIKPIEAGEFNWRGGNNGGGGGNSGPNIIEEFWAFWEQKQRDAMSNVAGQIYDINKAYNEQVKAAIKLGMVEELEAARLAELARIRTDFLKSYTDDELSDYTRAVNELNEAFSDQALLDEYIGQEDELARVRHNAMMRLREDLLDSFDSPMEGTRDNLADLIARFRDLDEANRALNDDFQRGTMTAEEYADALEHSRQVQEEFNAQMAVSLLNMAVYFTDAMGDEQKSAEIRAKLAEFEYNLKLAEFELTLETAYAQHWINTELYLYLKDILDRARENPPDFNVPPVQQGGGGDSGSQSNPLEDMLQALLRALDRLRNILQSYTDFLKGLQNSDLSPYSIEQQYNTAQSEYERLLALAQAGDLNAMELLPEAAQTYLELAEQMFGTSSAGYNDIFQQINADMTEIMGSIQDILDQVPSQYQPIEQKLDTIAEILDNMYLLWMNFDAGDTGGGGGGWTPPGPAPTAPRTLQEFFEAYNLDWSQLSNGELMDVMNSVQSILADNQVSNVEMSDFVAAMEAMLGMDAGSMTQAQINALRTWLYQQVGNMDSNGGNNNAQGGDNSQNNATGGNKSGASLSNNYAAQMNKNLEIIASLTAKGLRDSSSERYKKPRLTYAGYVGSRSKPMRAS